MTEPARPLPLGDIDEHAEQAMVAMRDGVRLATDVYLPARAPRGPTVLVRLPYDKSARFGFMPQIAARFLEHGCSFVAQDVRGKARSEGGTFAFVHEVDDGWETLEWISSQPWCDGTIGMFGDSYYGFTQWAAAVSGHPSLRAIVPRVTTTDIGGDWVYHQGVFCLFTMAEWAAQTWVDNRLYEQVPDFSIRPLGRMLTVLHGGRSSASLEHWRRTPPEDPFWTEGIFGTSDPLAAVRIPVLHSGGWWDVFQRGQVRDFQSLRARGVAAQHLIMGSTDHFDDPLLADGESPDDFMLSEAALERFLPGYVAPALSFFERHLKGGDEAAPSVRWHLANAGWEVAGSWPPDGTRALRLYAADAHRATVGAGGGALTDAPDRGTTEVRWLHDPADPVPDLIEDAWRPLLGLPDEREVESREDVLTFTGEPQPGPLDLAGPAAVDAPLSVAQGPAHVTAKLVDVYPSGRARRILQGAARVSDPSGSHVRIDLGHTGYRLPAGHRLRLEIAATDFPRYLPEAADRSDPWAFEEAAPSERALSVGGTSGAALELTVRPRER